MAPVPKLLLVLLFLSYYGSPIAHAGDDASPSHRAVLSIDGSLRTNNSVCSKSKVVRSSSGAATVPLNHRHGPCSPLRTKNKKVPTLEETLQRDQLRAAYIQSKYSGGGDAAGVQQSAVTVPTTLGEALHTDEYLITVQLGSPAKSQTIMIDTGSDVSWVQCKPCFQCHSQVDPLFDPSSSTTYSPFSCSSAGCAQLNQDGGGNGCSSSGQCQYFVRYGDGSTTAGTYGSDTLALGSSSVSNFRFGCSHDESGLILNDLTAGLMGLGRGSESLVSQTAGTFSTAVFSYCLPPTVSSSGFLTLGAAGTASGFVKTPMLQHPTFYGVRLEAIRVGGWQLNIPTSVFSGGSIMDSGTVITMLPPTAYSALSSAFKAGMKQYKPAPPVGGLDACYDFSGLSSVSVPAVALVFSGGAAVNLPFHGIMIETWPGSGTWCLAFIATRYDGQTGIIGNVQQRTFEVLHDVAGGTMGFRAGAC